MCIFQESHDLLKKDRDDRQTLVRYLWDNEYITNNYKGKYESDEPNVPSWKTIDYDITESSFYKSDICMTLFYIERPHMVHTVVKVITYRDKSTVDMMLSHMDKAAVMLKRMRDISFMDNMDNMDIHTYSIAGDLLYNFARFPKKLWGMIMKYKSDMGNLFHKYGNVSITNWDADMVCKVFSEFQLTVELDEALYRISRDLIPEYGTIMSMYWGLSTMSIVAKAAEKKRKFLNRLYETDSAIILEMYESRWGIPSFVVEFMDKMECMSSDDEDILRSVRYVF